MQFKIKISLLNKYILNFPGIAEAGVNNVKWMIVEFDEDNKNIVDGIKESYIYFTSVQNDKKNRPPSYRINL